MSVVVEFHRLAIRDYVSARRWYAPRGVEAAFVQAVDAAVARIEANPAGGVPAHRPCRWVRAGRFPYLLYYRPVGASVVEVVAVAHSKRRLGYWLRRLRRP